MLMIYITFLNKFHVFNMLMTPLYMPIKNLSDVANMVNTELECINEWIKLNKLSLNITKTSYMVVSATTRKCDSNDWKIIINDQSIERVNHTQFLGVIIDDKLTWSQHVNHISNTVSKGMGIFLRHSQFCMDKH